jgi:hypothetical protein
MMLGTEGTLTPQLALLSVPRIPRAKEHTMIPHFRPACLALVLVATAGPACAQTWIYESDYGPRVYRPRVVYQERYVPRVYNAYNAYDAYAYEPVVTAPPVAVARTRRTVVSRTIIPQGRGRGPIVKERIVTETTAPVVRSRVVDYAYGTRPVVVEYGPRATDSYALAPIEQPVVTTVPVVRPYRYINNRLAVDPVTGVFLSDIND